MSWGRLSLFVAASGALHASLGMVEQPASREAARGPRHEPVQVDFSIEDGVHVAPELPREPPPPPRPRPRAHDAPPPPSISPQPVDATPPTPPSPPTPAPSPGPSVVDISPLAAARGLVDVRSQPAQAEAGQHGPKLAGIPLAAYLKSTAGMPTITSRAEDPSLRPRRGGGYEFEGTGFDATIDTDGTVHFDDKYAQAQFTLVPSVKPDGTATVWFFKVTYDLEAWLEHLMGNDLYRSERRWFLERTAELRDRLALAAFERGLERARVALRHSLQSVWNDPRRSIEQKKRETFEHWDMNANDEIGALGRKVVEEFVRQRCPPGSACEFTPSECAGFNNARKSHVPFQPYE